MKAEKNKVVSLTYELIVDGVLADKADETRPLEYIHGTGMLLPKFESEVEGKEPGEEFAFTLTPEEGYGTYDATRLVELPKEAFMIDGKVREDLLVIGKMIPMVNDSGQVVNGRVYLVTDDKVIMDFNHPMAGKTLNFTGKVVEVREATEKELKKGHPCHRHHHDDECCHKGEGECHKEGKHHGDGECCHGEGKCEKE
jgi:FKBP-type peptidyl-prolyl cis-trans isomerase SlyD